MLDVFVVLRFQFKPRFNSRMLFSIFTLFVVLAIETNSFVVHNKQENMWVSNEESEDEFDNANEVKEKLSLESLKRNELVKVIQAHERCR